MELPPVLERYRTAIDAELRRALADRYPSLYDLLRYHLGWIDEHGRTQSASLGKYLRPALCLLACEAASGDHGRALPAAAAVELVHSSSLVLDDIQDDDWQRRGRATVWAVWGKRQALGAGMAMGTIANLALQHLEDHGASPAGYLRALRLLNETCLTMVEGQYLDISYETRLDIGPADYLAMVEKKTVSLIACALALGALLGGANEATIQALRRFGHHLGMAFQIRDDALGIWGRPEQTGKAAGSDIRKRKKSFPIVYALGRLGGRERAELAAIYRSEIIADADLPSVLSILDAAEARAQAEAVTHSCCSRALAELEGVALAPWASVVLAGVARFLAERES